jgi:hypothetical protein
MKKLAPEEGEEDINLWNELITRAVSTPLREEAWRSAAARGWDNIEQEASLAEWNRANRVTSQERKLSGLEGIMDTHLPDILGGYIQPAREAISITAGEPVRDRNGVLEDEGSRLNSLVDSALTQLDEIMKIPTPEPSDDNYVRILSIKKEAAATVITSGLKADETRFRKRNVDVLGTIFAAIRGETVEGAPVRVIN